jgi:hypothetical protein
MVNWFCKNCFVAGHDCGPWDDEHQLFRRIKIFHHKHVGFQIGEPEPIKKLSEIEQVFTDYFNSHIDEWLHNVGARLKGPTKVCLLKDKSKWRNITWIF